MKANEGRPTDLVKIYTASQHLEAEMIKAILEDEDIPVVVQGEAMESAGVAQQFRGYAICVPAERVDEARELLEERRGEDWTCPKCGEKIEGVFDACWQCGQARKPE